MPEEIIVYQVFDYDGCIGNNRNGKLTPEALVASLSDFLDLVKSEEPPGSRSYVGIGTARQSKRYDVWSKYGNNSTSCYGLYAAIADYWGVELDRFLLADLRGKLDDNTSFERATNPKYKDKHADWYFDPSKITLLYTKMHRAAVLHPDAEVIINFYDDNEDILFGLEDFFLDNENLIPKNVTLRLCYCFDRGREYEDHATLVGNEKSLGTDEHYKKTMRKVGQHIQKHGLLLDIPGLKLNEQIRTTRTMHQLKDIAFFEQQTKHTNTGAAECLSPEHELKI
jgi:hypothetical protein